MQDTTAAPAGTFGFVLPLQRNREFLMHSRSFKDIEKDPSMYHAFKVLSNQLGFYISEGKYFNHVLIRMSHGR